MTKYDPLHTTLKKRTEPEIKLTFAEIERILQAPLPATARQRNQWWANETPPQSRHVQCHAWRDAGYKAVPDLSRQTVIFKKLYV
jgi:hypothetical protein